MKIQYRESETEHNHTNVLIDGEIVATYRKRNEYYGNIGRRGATYTYFDVYRVDSDGKRIVEVETTTLRDGSEHKTYRPFASNSTRKQALAEALVLLGRDEAALIVDRGIAEHYIRNRSLA